MMPPLQRARSRAARPRAPPANGSRDRPDSTAEPGGAAARPARRAACQGPRARPCRAGASRRRSRRRPARRRARRARDGRCAGRACSQPTRVESDDHAEERAPARRRRTPRRGCRRSSRRCRAGGAAASRGQQRALSRRLVRASSRKRSASDAVRRAGRSRRAPALIPAKSRRDGLVERQRGRHGAHQRVVGRVEERIEVGGDGGEPGGPVEAEGPRLPGQPRPIERASEVEQQGGGVPVDALEAPESAAPRAWLATSSSARARPWSGRGGAPASSRERW